MTTEPLKERSDADAREIERAKEPLARVRRAYSQAYRAFLLMRRDGFRLLDVTVWPLVVLVSTALLVGYFSSNPNVMGLVILGALGWRVLYCFQIEPVQGYMDEYWSDSLDQLMISPLRRVEFLAGGLVSAVFKSVIVSALFLVLGAVFFGYAPSNWFAVLEGVLAIAFTGIILAIFSLGVAYLKGRDAFAFIYAFPDFIAVFSGVFYPISVFPEPLRSIVQLLPSSYAFAILKTAVGFPAPNYTLFFLTCAAWLAIAYWFNNWAFNAARRDGKLAKLQ